MIMCTVGTGYGLWDVDLHSKYIIHVTCIFLLVVSLHLVKERFYSQTFNNHISSVSQLLPLLLHLSVYSISCRGLPLFSWGIGWKWRFSASYVPSNSRRCKCHVLCYNKSLGRRKLGLGTSVDGTRQKIFILLVYLSHYLIIFDCDTMCTYIWLDN